MVKSEKRHLFSFQYFSVRNIKNYYSEKLRFCVNKLKHLAHIDFYSVSSFNQTNLENTKKHLPP